jgi:cobalt-zinc-cadmium efflux system outer membrane protein
MSRVAATGLFATFLLASLGSPARAQEAGSSPSPRLRLEDLERMALAANPTIAQAAAAVKAAEGRRRQEGLFPNPVIGYKGEELTTDRFRFTRQTKHVWFIEQSLITGRRLKRSRQVYEHAKAEAEAEAQEQRQRVLTAVRGLYYDALVAHRLVGVRQELARLAREAVGISGELYNIGQADQPDVLQAEIEAQRAEIDGLVAKNEELRVWQVLGAVVGDPSLQPQPLEGDIEVGLPILDEASLVQHLITESPEVKAAQARRRRAEAEVARTRAERFPDLMLEGGISYNYDRSHGLGGWAGLFGLKFALPLFDRRQGALASARADVEIATQEARRLELSLRARLASALRRYGNARERAERYQKSVLPNAEKAYALYLGRFREMAAAYPQVLIAQRTLAQVKAEYLAALGEAWHEATLLQGFLLSGGLHWEGETGTEGAEEWSGEANGEP